MKTIQLFIADDHRMFLQGISSLMEQKNGVSVIGTAINGKDALDKISELQPDIVMLDIQMPEVDGVALTKLLKAKFSQIKILIVSTFSNTQIISRLTRLGVDGYVLKNAPKEILFEAVDQLMLGNHYFQEEIKAKLQDNQAKIKRKNIEVTELSKREKEILQLISQEFTAPEIADKMSISINTVNTHRRNLLSKLNVKNMAGLVKYAIENGLLD